MAQILGLEETDEEIHAGSPPLSRALLHSHLDGLCVPGVLSIVVQPVMRLADFAVVGYEALSRMPISPRNGPDWWLQRAEELSMRGRLEIACWRAITELGPPPEGTLLFVNASPAVLAEPDMLALRDSLPDRIVIEVTEQQAVEDYRSLRTDLVPWLSANALLAIDDTGAGHSSLRHVIELSPDFLKIDRSLVHNVDSDRNRRALVRSLVAFAREVGCTVIAEGVETTAELEMLRDAEVDLAQGFLFGRPARPWPQLPLGVDGAPQLMEPASGRLWSFSLTEREQGRLRRRLGLAHDARSACEAVAEFLYRQGDLMPSVYLERRGQLRCVAQRGLWQVLDGLSETSGITGRTWASNGTIVVPDVGACEDYLEAIPGVEAEACVPIVCEGKSIGALNVESLTRLPPATEDLLQYCARLLGARLSVIGWSGSDAPWQRTARASVTISGLALERDPAEAALGALCEAAGMDSAGIIWRGPEGLSMRCADGPLAPVLEAIPAAELTRLSTLVDHIRSCYTGNDATGRGFVGTESLRAFARAVVVLPLHVGGNRLGTVLLAHSRPRALSGEDVEPLELLAGHLAAVLSASSLVDRLRQQAREDHLTGLGNRAAFEHLLDDASDTTRLAAVILDIDHFKVINDERGHLIGDEALCSLAEYLSTQFPELRLFRYGGDEFALLIEGDQADEALSVARALCAAARHVLSPYSSSVTAGIALAEDRETPRALLGRADAALLWAKRYARGTATAAHADVRLPHPA